MTQRTAIFAGLIALGLCGASFAQAQSYYYGYGPRVYDQGLPPYEIMRIVRSTGLAPLSRPMRRGPTYVVVAATRSGGQMRVVVDAITGDIMTVNPMVAMRPYGAQPYYPGGPVDEPPGAYAGDHRFDGGVPPVPPRDVPTARMMPPPAAGMGPPPAPRDPPNPRVANAPPLASPAPLAPARTPLPRPRPNIAASEPATTGAVPAAPPAASKAPASSLPTATAPAIINPATAPTQIVPVAPLE